MNSTSKDMWTSHIATSHVGSLRSTGNNPTSGYAVSYYYYYSNLKKQLVSLRIQKSQFSDRKYIRRPIESKPDRVVNYLQFVDCFLDGAKQNVEP